MQMGQAGVGAASLHCVHQHPPPPITHPQWLPRQSHRWHAMPRHGGGVQQAIKQAVTQWGRKGSSPVGALVHVRAYLCARAYLL